MIFDHSNLPSLILFSLPFQFNLIINSFDLILSDMKKEWKTRQELTNSEYNLGQILTYNVGMITSIIFIFVFYRYGKARLIISIIFILSGFTWLVYYAVNENRIYILFIIRSFQGIYLGVFQLICFPYIIRFAKNTKQCMLGCLIQFSMFLGLFFISILFYFLNYKTIIIIFFVFSVLFSLLIWLVPEMYIKPKSVTNEFITSRSNFAKIIIMLITMLFQQLSGIGSLFSKLTYMLENIGVCIETNLQSCLYTVIGGISTIISAFIIDSVSTKIMWSFSSFGLIISLFIYCLTLKLQIEKWIGTLSFFLYFLFYGLGQGPIPWYLCCTLFNDGVRIETSAINLFSCLFLAPIMNYFFNWLYSMSGEFGSILFSMISCFVAIFHGLFFIPFDKKSSIVDLNII